MFYQYKKIELSELKQFISFILIFLLTKKHTITKRKLIFNLKFYKLSVKLSFIYKMF